VYFDGKSHRLFVMIDNFTSGLSLSLSLSLSLVRVGAS